RGGQDHVEARLLLGRLDRTVAGTGAGSHRRGGDCGRRDAERLLERLDALGELEDGDRLELVNPLLGGGHASSLSSDGSASDAASVAGSVSVVGAAGSASGSAAASGPGSTAASGSAGGSGSGSAAASASPAGASPLTRAGGSISTIA